MKKESNPKLFRRIADFWYGYDFFISYTRRKEGEHDPGGILYAEELDAALEKAGFKCFLDSHDYAMGDAWKGVGARKLKMTSQLLLVASPAALEAPAVVREVEIFSRKSRGRIIPIDFGGTIRARDESKPVFDYLADDILFLEESPDRLGSGPSEEVVTRLKAGFDLTRQDSKRARFFASMAVVFGLISVAAIAAGVLAQVNAAMAKRNETTANRNLIESFTIQGQENVERGNYGPGVAYLTHAIRKADESGLVEAAREAELRLSSALSGGRFPVLQHALIHEAGLKEVQFSPSGNLIYTVTTDQRGHLWKKGEKQWEEVGSGWEGGDWQRRAAFSRDEKRVVIPAGKTLHFYNTETGEAWRGPVDLGEEILEVDLNRDEDHVVVSFADESQYWASDIRIPTKNAAILNLASGERVRSFPIDSEVAQVGLEGRYAVFKTDFVELAPPFNVKKLPFGFLDEVAFRGDGKSLLAVEGMTPRIFRYDTWELHELRTDFYNDEAYLKQLTSSMGDYQIAPQSGVLLMEQREALTGERFQVILTEIGKAEYNDELVYRGFRILPNRDVFLSPRGDRLAIERGGESVQIVDKETGAAISSQIHHPGKVTRVEFASDGETFATIARDNVLRIWSGILLRRPAESRQENLPVMSARWLLSGNYLESWMVNYSSPPVSLFDNGRFLVEKGDDNLVTVKNMDRDTVIFGPIHSGGRLISAAVSPDGRYLACGFQAPSAAVEAWASVWDLETGEKLMRLSQGGSSDAKLLSNNHWEGTGRLGVVAVAFSPDSRMIGTLCAREEGDGDREFMGWQLRRARVWNVEARRPATEWLEAGLRSQLSENDHERLNVELKADRGDDVASDVGDGHYRESAAQYLNAVTMAFSADGKALEFSIAGETVQQWDWSEMTERKRLLSSADALSGLRYSEAQGRLVEVPDRDRIQLWEQLRDDSGMIRFLRGKQNRGIVGED